MNSSLISRRWARLLSVGTLLGVAACITAICCQKSADPQEPDPGPPFYQDMTLHSGIDFTYRNGEEAEHYAILESLGGGLALIDYDGDGWLDIFFTGGGYYDGPDKKTIKGHPNRLYKNMGNWKFKDVSKEVGLDQPLFYTHGAAVADYDRDGWPDLLVTGYGEVKLFRNVPDPRGGRRFVDVTREAGLEGGHFWATSAAFADLDGDGFPDLYVCQYVNWSWKNNPKCRGYNSKSNRDVCPPKQFDSVPHALYYNDGKGHFINVTARAGIRVPPRKDKDYGKGLGVIIVDVDGDGKPDIYIANDTTPNFLYLNQSRPGRLSFRDIGDDKNVALNDRGGPDGSMGLGAADIEGKGRPSIWVTNYAGENHALYRNIPTRNGKLFFTHATNAAGIAAIGQEYVGFGTGFLDVDNDGWEDIFISNGHVIKHPYPEPLRQKPVLFFHSGTGFSFNDQTERGGPYFRTGHVGRGVAIGDLDNDGWPDLVISHVQEPVTLLRNIAQNGNHWLGVKLSAQGNADHVGARLTLDVNGKKLTRFSLGGGSYLSASDRRKLFGLGSSGKAGTLKVEWPSGEPRVETWNNLEVDTYHHLVQGQSTKNKK